MDGAAKILEAIKSNNLIERVDIRLTGKVPLKKVLRWALFLTKIHKVLMILKRILKRL